MTLSDQALSCLMVALQKSLMEQTDIVPVLRALNFTTEGEQLVVTNPPQSLSVSQVLGE